MVFLALPVLLTLVTTSTGISTPKFQPRQTTIRVGVSLVTIRGGASDFPSASPEGAARFVQGLSDARGDYEESEGSLNAAFESFEDDDAVFDEDVGRNPPALSEDKKAIYEAYNVLHNLAQVSFRVVRNFSLFL